MDIISDDIKQKVEKICDNCLKEKAEIYDIKLKNGGSFYNSENFYDWNQNEFVINLFSISQDDFFAFYEINNDLRIKRPMEWALQDITNGNIIEVNNCLTKDFVDKDFFSSNTLIDNESNSPFFDDVNNILKSLKKWENNILKELKNEVNNKVYNLKVLKKDNEYLSSKEYVLNHIKDYFNQMSDVLYVNMGNEMSNANNEYIDELFNAIRDEYLSKNYINKSLIKKYTNSIKYLWPDSYMLVNAFNNIEGIQDIGFDNEIDKMLENKRIMKEKEIDEKNKMHELMDKIDRKIEELEKEGN